MMNTQKIRDSISLVCTRFSTTWYQAVEFVNSACRYYRGDQFAFIDLKLRSLYFLRSPFKASKDFMEARQADQIHVYGETPLTSWEKIVEKTGLSAKDVFCDLGSGTGRVAFWTHQKIGCQVIGIEWVPEFVQKAQKIVEQFRLQGISFIQGDFSMQLPPATVYYLSGTCVDEEVLKALIKKMDGVPSGTKVITTSFPLNEYEEGKAFEIMNRFAVPFAWGDADVYVNVRR